MEAKEAPTKAVSRLKRTLLWMLILGAIHGALLGGFALMNFLGGQHVHGEGYAMTMPTFAPVRVALLPAFSSFSFEVFQLHRAFDILIAPIWVAILMFLLKAGDGSDRPGMKTPIYAGTALGIASTAAGLWLTYGKPAVTSTFTLDRTASTNALVALTVGITCCIVALVISRSNSDNRSVERPLWTAIFAFVGAASATAGLAHGLPLVAINLVATCVLAVLGAVLGFALLTLAAGSLSIFAKGVARIRNR